MKKNIWIYCEHCGEKLIQRMWNGLFRFRFGKPVRINEESGEKQFSNSPTPVDIYIHGSVKMRCFHRGCRKWNILNYFPNKISGPAETGKMGIINDIV